MCHMTSYSWKNSAAIVKVIYSYVMVIPWVVRLYVEIIHEL